MDQRNSTSVQATLQTYERFIDSSRQHFRSALQHPLAFDDLIKLADDIYLRLDYYRHIRAYRKQLRQSTRHPSPSNRTFDFSLCIKNGHETKEYDFADRPSSELLTVLARMKEEIE